MTAVIVLIFFVASFAALYLMRDLSRGLRDLGRERNEMVQDLQALKDRVDLFEEYLRRQNEELIVLMHIILERGIADEDDIEDIRHRCIEIPMRRAEEQDGLFRNVDEEVVPFILDDDEISSVH